MLPQLIHRQVTKTRFTMMAVFIGIAWTTFAVSDLWADLPVVEHGQPSKMKDRTKLTLSRIYDGDEFKVENTALKWDPNIDAIIRKEDGEEGNVEIIRRRIGTADQVSAASHTIVLNTDPIGVVEDYEFSHDAKLILVKTRSQRVWRHNTLAEYWIYDIDAGSWRAVSGGERVMFATFSPESNLVAYVRAGGLHVEQVETGKVSNVATSDRDELIHGTLDWVYEEELGLKKGFEFNRDGTMLAFWQVDQTGVPQQTLIDNTSGRYPQLKQFAYPKVGQVNSSVRIGVHHLATQKTTWIAVEGDPRNHYLASLQWVEPHSEEQGNGVQSIADEGATAERLLIQQLNRRQNTNRLWVAEPMTGHALIALTETSSGWLTRQGHLPLLSPKSPNTGGVELVWESERSGWRHLYRLKLDKALFADPLDDGSDVKVAELSPITSGDWDVIGVDQVDADTGKIHFTASPTNPASRGLYCVEANAPEPTLAVQRVSPAGDGTFGYQVSPTSTYAIETWSDFDSPPVKRLVNLDPYQVIENVDDNQTLRDTLSELDPVQHEFASLAIGGGVTLESWIMMPANASSQDKVPLLLYVYGEPAGQTVRDVFGGKTYLWHRMMVQNGIAVASIDNRGTASPRGLDFRQAVYGQIGILPPADQAAGANELLRTNPWLDPNHVGVWGWSGGGSSSLHAIFRYPSLFKTAVAIAPVSDQRDYDTIYQERYMGLIEDNLDGLIEGSPITHAKNLEGSLLVIHGTGDDNVHYASTERLFNELISQGKSFEMMAYPGRSHSISEGSGTAIHLRRKMTDFLLRTLNN